MVMNEFLTCDSVSLQPHLVGGYYFQIQSLSGTQWVDGGDFAVETQE